MPTGLQATLDGYSPIGTMPTGKAREDVLERPAGDKSAGAEETDCIEKAIAAFVDRNFTEAQQKTLDRRQAFDQMFADMFGDIPGDDDTELANYVLPVVGNHVRRLAMMIAARTIPDRELMNFFQSGPPQGAMVDRAAIRDSIVAEYFIRDCLRAGRFDATWDRWLVIYLGLGNAVGTWEWVQEWKCVEVGADPLEDQVVDVASLYAGAAAAETQTQSLSGDQGIGSASPSLNFDPIDDGLGGYIMPTAKHEMKLVRQYPKYRIIDMRNWLPSTLQCAGGGEELDWFCEHDTMRWRHLRENRVRRRPSDGAVVGCYANTDRFGPKSEQDVSPILSDVYDSQWIQGRRAIPWRDKGLNVRTYCGRLNLEEAGPFDGKALPEKREWDTKLRKFGNDPGKCKDCRWWLIQTINGVVVRMQPHPYYGGDRCPIEHDRYLVDEGFTYGRGMYANGVGVSQNLYNYLNRLEIDGVELSIRPPVAVDVTAVDPAHIQRRGGAWLDLPPRAVLELNPGANALQAIQELRPPAEAINQVRLQKAEVRRNAGEYDTMTSTVEGQGPSGADPTATQSIQDANFSLVPIEHEAKRLSRSLSAKLEKLGRVIQDYAAPQVGVTLRGAADMQRLAAYDDDAAEQVAAINQQGAQYLQGMGLIYAQAENDDFFGNLSITCYGPLMGGGKGARAQALANFGNFAMQAEKVSPGLLNMRVLLSRMAQNLEIYDPEGLLNDEMTQQLQSANNADLLAMQGMAQAAMGSMGGAPGAGALGKKGEASPPAQRGSNMGQVAA